MTVQFLHICYPRCLTCYKRIDDYDPETDPYFCKRHRKKPSGGKARRKYNGMERLYNPPINWDKIDRKGYTIRIAYRKPLRIAW